MLVEGLDFEDFEAVSTATLHKIHYVHTSGQLRDSGTSLPRGLRSAMILGQACG